MNREQWAKSRIGEMVSIRRSWSAGHPAVRPNGLINGEIISYRMSVRGRGVRFLIRTETGEIEVRLTPPRGVTE